MATTTITRRTIEGISPTRRIIYGVIFLVLALIILFMFTLKMDPATISTMALTPTGVTRGAVGDLVFPALPAMIVMNALVAIAGIYQIVWGFGKRTNLILGLTFLVFLITFLMWTAGSKTLFLGSLLYSGITLSVPVILGAYSGVLSERAGVVNIAIEGMMLMAAMVGALMGSVTHSAWLGLLCGVTASLILAALHAVLSIKYKINQIISGTVINIFPPV